MRTLSRRELNRALLARQLLLERRRVPATRAIECLAGLQAQWEPAARMGLATRLDGFRPQQLDGRRVVRATLMRSTIHLVSARDYLLFLPALLPALRRTWERYHPGEADDPELERLGKRLLGAAHEPRSANELRGLLEDDERGSRWFRLRHHVPLVRVGDAYVSAEAWLGRPFATPDEGRIHLLRRYLRAFGPATAADIAAWSGLQVSELRPSLETLRLRRFQDEAGRTLLDEPGAPLPTAETPAPPRLLPRFDNIVLSHADRTRVIADEHRRRIVRAAEVDATFLLDGFVAGRWKLERGKLELDPFVELTRKDVKALEEEASRLAARA
jgi:winged helix DNA-binding protein